MIKIKINEQIKNVAKGTTPLELLDESAKKNYYTCLVNKSVRELKFKLSFDAEVEFLDITNTESMKAYEASLRYLIAKALIRPFPAL